MITDIKTFIADAKELYPDFSFDSFDENSTFEEKFKFFKELDKKLKEKYGDGYFKAKEELEKFWNWYYDRLSLPIACDETNIIYSLYSADLEVIGEYRRAALKMDIVPTIIANSIIDDCCTEELAKNELFYERLLTALCVAELSYESMIHYNYKMNEPHLTSYEPATIAQYKIEDVEQLKFECKELLKRDEAMYNESCFIIIDLWSEEDLMEFSKSNSELLKGLVCCQVNCSKKIVEKLMQDESCVVAFIANERYEELRRTI